MLQFFTDQKIQARTAWDEYQQYWREHWTRMPESLRLLSGVFAELPNSVYMHDARIRGVDRGEFELGLLLRGDYHGGLREMHLRYLGVKYCSGVTGEMLDGAPYNDMMLHEITIHPGGGYRHAMLFASKELLVVDFAELLLHVFD